MSRSQGVALSLFWRTFVLLAILLGSGIIAWVWTLRSLEFEPRAVAASQQIASLVNVARAALRTSDSINRVAMVKNLSVQEAIRIAPHEPSDKWDPFEEDRFTRVVAAELHNRLGPDTIVARSVNGQAGLWVGFGIEKDAWWLQTELGRVRALTGPTWFVWVGIALLATIFGSVAIARLINQPLRELSFAASRIREGEFDSRLDENTMTSEIREVNMGFNRMARELAKVEEDRAVMLAGISHDLRTPLARLRLEAEMSVHDEEAQQNMALDIDQLDAIIDKFMDYARPGDTKLKPVNLAQVVEREMQGFRDPTTIRIAHRVAIDVSVLADEIELGRVFSNLFENARRYGRTVDTGIAVVHVTYARTGPWVIVSVRDQAAVGGVVELQRSAHA
ncbi:MAG TPA: histidine kinase dimerization/phospho-acceptor domain-containing protein, partial [Burkholderiaceae bacterium]